MASDRTISIGPKLWCSFCAAVVVCLLLALPALSEEHLGPVTNQPLPRFVSLKGEEGNVRRGPSLTHRIDWVFTRRGMPLQVVGEYGNWRQVRDRDGAGGWMHYFLLSRARTVIVQEDLAALHSSPDANSPIRARAEAGVIARLGPCREGFCRIQVGRTRGWAPTTALWGINPKESPG
jgi:SH3-like domain-containing protein